MPTDKHIKKFQELYKKHFGMDIGKKEAFDAGSALIFLLEVIHTNKHKQEYEINRKEI